jgi:hypothetical protein
MNVPPVGFGLRSMDRYSSVGRLNADGPSVIATVMTAMNESVPPLGVDARDPIHGTTSFKPRAGLYGDSIEAYARSAAPSNQFVFWSV